MHAFIHDNPIFFIVLWQMLAFAGRAASFGAIPAKQKGFETIKISLFKNCIQHLFFIKVR